MATNLTKAKELWAAVIWAAHAWNEVALHAGQTAARARAPLARELTFRVHSHRKNEKMIVMQRGEERKKNFKEGKGSAGVLKQK